MNQKLIKQLEKANFPFEKALDTDMTYEPELGYLIEVCKDTTFYLHCYPHGYVISFAGKLDDMKICKTPIEAVIKLWIKLQHTTDEEVGNLNNPSQ